VNIRAHLILLVLILSAAPAFAQREYIENTIGFGPRVGWYSSNDAEEGAWHFGAMARLRIGNNVGLEATLDYRDSERFSAGRIDTRNYNADVAYLPLTASLMIFIPVGSNFTPYGVAGLGWYYTLVDYDILTSTIPQLRDRFEDENSFVPGYHFGLGLEITFGSHFALHGDFRYLFLDTEINSVRDVLSADIDTKNSDGLVLSAGFMVYL